MLSACSTSSSEQYSDQPEEDAYDIFDDNATVAYTGPIELPFIRSRVEEELTHLINTAQVAPRCAVKNKPDTAVLSQEALVKLSANSQKYWEKVLPGDPQMKHQVLSGVERSLDVHMATLEQTINATGLNVLEKGQKIVLTTADSPIAAPVAQVQLAQFASPVIKAEYGRGHTPVPVIKSAAVLAHAVPVPQFRQAKATVQEAKRMPAMNKYGINGINLAEGGPYIPSGSFKERYVNISQTLLKLATLSQIRQALPLGMPLDDASMTSHFGMRRDPFNRRMAFHSGIDFSAHGSPPVHATAPGVVIFAGWRSGYGNTVIINHGLGLTTRYAHLSHIAVRKGTRIKERQVVGYEGSTGRSTGNHVHYEIRLNNTAIDPTKFIEAGSHQSCAES